MAYLAKGKKQDLVELADELGVAIEENFKILEIKNAIIKSPTYDEEFTKECLNRIVNDRKEQSTKENEQLFELEKLRLQIENKTIVQPSTDTPVAFSHPPNLQLKNLIPEFDPKVDDMSLFLNLFQRQLKFLKVEKEHWVAYLLGVLPNDIAQLIARETEEKAQDFEHIKDMLLHRFKLSAEKLRQLFATHKKSQNQTWKDFHFELRSYFEGWLEELNIKDFDGIKNLMILDQMKKRVPPDVKDHFLDVWCDWVTPDDLVEKMDIYDNLRTSKKDAQMPIADARKKFYHNQTEQQRTHNHKGNFYAYNSHIKYQQKYDQQSLSGFPNQSRRDPGVPSQSRRDSIHNDRVYKRATGRSFKYKFLIFNSSKPLIPLILKLFLHVFPSFNNFLAPVLYFYCILLLTVLYLVLLV